jgi:hypothetical protein
MHKQKPHRTSCINVNLNRTQRQIILKAADKDIKFSLTALGRDPMLYEALIQATGNAAGKAARKGRFAVSGR